MRGAPSSLLRARACSAPGCCRWSACLLTATIVCIVMLARWAKAHPRTLAVLIAFGVTRRVGELAISKPAREALFTVVPR